MNPIESLAQTIQFNARELSSLMRLFTITGAMTMTDYDLAIAEREIQDALESLKRIVTERSEIREPVHFGTVQ